MTSFKPKPLFPKRKKLPGGLRLKPGIARPSPPIKGAPPLPFTAQAEEEARMHFAKGELQKMRRKLEEENQ